jgi:hypothetical protein
MIPDASPCFLFASSLPPLWVLFGSSLGPLWVLFASSESEVAMRRFQGPKKDPKRTQRGGKEENPRRMCHSSQVFPKTVTGFVEDRHIFERWGGGRYIFALSEMLIVLMN